MQVTIHNVTESKFFQNQAPIGTPRIIDNPSAIAPPSSKLFGDFIQSPANLVTNRPHTLTPSAADFSNGNGKLPFHSLSIFNRYSICFVSHFKQHRQ
jgi:hypothetical protein